MQNRILPIFLSVFFLLLSITTPAQKAKKAVPLPEIAREIKKMRDEDQKMRNKWAGMIRKQKSKTEKFKELTNKLIAKDRANTARMREIIEVHGWPTYELVGEGPSNNAWLLVQHADRNPLFQANCLPLLKAAVEKGQANPSNYAYLYDRVQVSKGEKQWYATQSTSNNGLKEGTFYPIEDESNVQKRREAMGIGSSVEGYAQSMGFDYAIPTPEEAARRAEQLVLDYQSNIAQAKAAMASKDYTKAADFYIKVANAAGTVLTQDFIEAARALALAKHAQAGMGMTYLIRAMARGWDGFEQIKDHPDFAYLKESNPSSWSDFLITAGQFSLDR